MDILNPGSDFITVAEAAQLFRPSQVSIRRLPIQERLRRFKIGNSKVHGECPSKLSHQGVLSAWEGLGSAPVYPGALKGCSAAFSEVIGNLCLKEPCQHFAGNAGSKVQYEWHERQADASTQIMRHP
jgi:hypothetical protein